MTNENPIHSTHRASSPAADEPCICRVWAIVGYALAPVLAAALLVTYLIAPEFYLQYVLEGRRREYQFVENLGELASLAAGVLLLWAAHLIWHAPGNQIPGSQTNQHRKAALIIAVVGVAALFLCIEEVSWGQKYFGWDTPERYAQHSVETNLHNNKAIPISIQSLGALFIITVFFGMPIAWALRDKFPAAAALKLAVASGPAITIVAFAFLWKKWKTIHIEVAGKDSTFYTGFIEQINEQDEMFVGLGLFVYGLTCLKRAKCLRASSKL